MKKIAIGIIVSLSNISAWSACSYNLNVTQATLDIKHPYTKVFPLIVGQKVEFSISDTMTSSNANGIKTYIAANNNDMLNGTNASIQVPTSGIFVYEYKFKVPEVQLNNEEQITFFPLAALNEKNNPIANISYLNSSKVMDKPINAFLIYNSKGEQFEFPVINTSDGYQKIGVYINQDTKQVGYIFNGVNKGYLDNLGSIVNLIGFAHTAGITGFSSTSINLNKHISIELITDKSQFTQSYPAGSTDICGNRI